MLRSLRNPRGGPAPHVRALAALVAFALFALAAPVILPVLRWLFGLLLP